MVRAFLTERRSVWARRVVPTDQFRDAAARPQDIDVRLDVREALLALPPRQRATIVLRFYYDLSVAFTRHAAISGMQSTGVALSPAERYDSG
jgi:DNA-directed RNA polymerase specialized sigma24 family protein